MKFVLPVIIIVRGIIVSRITAPKPGLDVLYSFLDTKPYRKDALDKLNPEYEMNETNNFH